MDYVAEKGKAAQTSFCQAELQNNLKLDTDPSRHRKFSMLVNETFHILQVYLNR